MFKVHQSTVKIYIYIYIDRGGDSNWQALHFPAAQRHLHHGRLQAAQGHGKGLVTSQ